PHLPVGVDAFTARHFAQSLADRLVAARPGWSAVLAPTLYLGSFTFESVGTVSVRQRVVRDTLVDYGGGLARTDRQQHHRARALERVQRGGGHLLQQVNAQKLLPFVAASHSVLARSSSAMIASRSATSRRAAAPCVAVSSAKRRRLRNRPAPAR